MAAAAHPHRLLTARLAERPFCCLGAAHVDRILTLAAPAVYGRTNPVSSATLPGGVAYNIAATLCQLRMQVSLCCAPVLRQVSTALRRLGIKRHNLPAPRHDSSYAAVINSSGELEIGLAAMEAYERIGAALLPDDFPFCQHGTVIIDAAFQPELMAHATQLARAASCLTVGAGTSPAKVGKLARIAWDLFVLNEAEAAALLGRSSSAAQMARRIAAQTGGAVAVTCGAQGATLASGNRLLHQKPPPFCAANANGAGDAFTAVLACAFSAGFTPAAALRLAAAGGAVATRTARSFATRLSTAYRHAPPSRHLQRGVWRDVPPEEYLLDG